MEQTTKHNKGIKGGDVKEWFEEVIHTLKSDQLMLEHDVASEKQRSFTVISLMRITRRF
jgi:hypothetical protein